MIIFKEHPYPCSFSKNPIAFTLHATNFSTEISVFPSITLTFNYEVQEGKLFYFQYTNPDTKEITEARFIADASPKKDGNEIPGNTTGAVAITQAYVDSVAEYMKWDRQLSSYYSIEVNGLDIILTAKRAVEELIPSGFYLNDPNGGGLGFAVVASISELYWQASSRDGHRVNLKVYFEKVYNSNHFEVVSEQSDIVDENGDLTIDISSIIDSEIRNSFEDPPLADSISPGAADKTQKGKVLRRFYIEASEIWRNMLPKVTWEGSKTCFAHFGGVSMDDFSRQNPIEYIHSEKMNLTWWPAKKRLYEHQEDWLTYMNFFGTVFTCSAHLELLYKDTTSDTFSLGSQELNPWESVMVPVGYKQLNVAVIQDPAKEVYGWKISFKDGADLITERKYLLIQAEGIFTRSMVYLNSFGVPESFVTTGFWESQLTTSSQLASRTLSHDYKSINGQDFIFSKQSKNLFSVRSGVLTKKENKALQDMLNVSPVFLIENGFTVPVIIDSGSFTINEEEDQIATLEFTLAKSMQLSNVSEMIKKPSLRLVNNCGMFEVFIDSEEEITTYNNLEVLKDGNTLFESVVYGVGKYQLANKIESAALYLFTVDVELSGETFTLKEKLFFDPESSNFLSPNHNAGANISVFEIKSSVNENLTVDFQNGAPLITNVIAGDLTVIGAVIPDGIKEHSIKSSCLSNIKEFRINDQTYREFRLQKMKNLEVLEIMNVTLPGSFSTADFKKLRVGLLEGNNITHFEIGLLRHLSSLSIKNNQMQAQAIEDLAKEIWNYRKLFILTGAYVYIYLTGNPGIVNITQETLNIKNGTGTYLGDGLVDHNILLIY